MRTGLIIGFGIMLDGIQGGLGISVLALQVLPIVGQAAAALAGAVAEVISFTFGAAFIITLIFTGLFSWSAVLGGSLVESIPILNMIVPGWTLMAWRCVHNKKVQERAAQQAKPAQNAQEAAPARNIDGIRGPEHALYEVVA